MLRTCSSSFQGSFSSSWTWAKGSKASSQRIACSTRVLKKSLEHLTPSKCWQANPSKCKTKFSMKTRRAKRNTLMNIFGINRSTGTNPASAGQGRSSRNAAFWRKDSNPQHKANRFDIRIIIIMTIYALMIGLQNPQTKAVHIVQRDYKLDSVSWGMRS